MIEMDSSDTTTLTMAPFLGVPSSFSSMVDMAVWLTTNVQRAGEQRELSATGHSICKAVGSEGRLTGGWDLPPAVQV